MKFIRIKTYIKLKTSTHNFIRSFPPVCNYIAFAFNLHSKLMVNYKNCGRRGHLSKPIMNDGPANVLFGSFMNNCRQINILYATKCINAVPLYSKLL
jgi:hypothetical protein